MIISNHTLAVVEQEFSDRFDHLMQVMCGNLFPGAYSGAQGLSKIKQKRLECYELNILTEQGIFLFLCIEPLLGNDFCQSAEWEVFLYENREMGDYVIQMFFKHLTSIKT